LAIFNGISMTFKLTEANDFLKNLLKTPRKIRHFSGARLQSEGVKVQ